MKVMLLNKTIFLLKPKFKIETCNEIQLRFHNIHISDHVQLAIINMLLKWHHINICKCFCKKLMWT